MGAIMDHINREHDIEPCPAHKLDRKLKSLFRKVAERTMTLYKSTCHTRTRQEVRLELEKYYDKLLEGYDV